MGLHPKGKNDKGPEKNDPKPATEESLSDRQIHQDLAIQFAMLHSCCSGGASFDIARCCLLFNDWYRQKIQKRWKEHFLKGKDEES